MYLLKKDTANKLDIFYQGMFQFSCYQFLWWNLRTNLKQAFQIAFNTKLRLQNKTGKGTRHIKANPLLKSVTNASQSR